MRISKKRAEPVKETQMVSLADIAFLLIFFFMLSSEFMKDRVEIDLPRVPHSVSTLSELTVSMDKESHLTLNGDPIAGVTIKDQARKLEEELKKILDPKATAEPKEREVRFKCDREVKYESYHPIYLAISRAGGTVAVMQEVQ